MKTEKIIEILTEYVDTLDEAGAIREIVRSRQKVYNLMPCFMLANLLVDLREEVAMAAAVKSTPPQCSSLSACKRLLKVAAKFTRPSFSAPWTGKNGLQFFCSSFHVLALADRVDIPDGEAVEQDPEFVEKVEKMITSIPSDSVQLDLPSVPVLKTHIKISKASKEFFEKEGIILWDFGPGKSGVNSKYLLDILEALPGCTAWQSPGHSTSFIYFKTENGSLGLLCPIRLSDDTPRERTADRYTLSEDLPQAKTKGESPAPANLLKPAASKTEEAIPPQIEEHSAAQADPNSLPPLSVHNVRFFWNGLKVNGGRLVRLLYSLDNHNDCSGPCVSLSCRDYAGHLPGELFTVENHTDLYTDYHDTDRATVTPDHPLYPYIRAAALKAATRDEPKYLDHLRAVLETPDRYPGHHDGIRKEIAERETRLAARLAARLAELETLPKGHATPADLAAVARFNYAAETARLAEEEARQQAEHERVLNQRAEGRRYIERIAAEHPHTPGAPLVRICWSECPAFYSWEEGALSLSVAAADIILTHYDQETATDGEHGYYKTKFVIEYTGPDSEPATYEGRYDLGDDDGGLVQHIRTFGKHLRDRGPYGNGNHLEDAAEQAALILDLADTLAAHLAPALTAPRRPCLSIRGPSMEPIWNPVGTNMEPIWNQRRTGSPAQSMVVEQASPNAWAL